MTTPTQPPPTTHTSADETDSFKRLYKMSTTAGVGAVDYVAINVPSVVAILAGLASVLVLMSNVLMVLPVFAILVGVIALYQIKKAGGTQSGQWLAIGGILLSLVFSGIVFAREYAEKTRYETSKTQIQALLDRFAADCSSGKYEEAYKLFSPDFQKNVPFDRFQGELKGLEADARAGKITKITWNGRLENIPTSNAARDVTRASVKLHLEKFPDGVEITPLLSRPAGKDEWIFESVDPLFRPPQQQQQRGGGGMGGM